MGVQWLWATIPLGFICLAAVATISWQLLHDLRIGELVSVPLVAEQELTINESGKMLLHGEGPRFTTAFAKLDYRLIDLADGRTVSLSTVLLKSSSSGLSRSRLSLRSLNVDKAGTYRLIVLGLDERTFEEPHTIIITHDRRGKMILKIVGLVFAGIGLLAGFGLSVVLYIVNT